MLDFIKAGALVKLRNGSQAKIYSVYDNIIHGAIKLDDWWSAAYWDLNDNDYDWSTNSRAIISEWVEPVEVILYAIYSADGKYRCGFYLKDEAEAYCKAYPDRRVVKMTGILK